jgi:hypothetical protein
MINKNIQNFFAALQSVPERDCAIAVIDALEIRG